MAYPVHDDGEWDLWAGILSNLVNVSTSGNTLPTVDNNDSEFDLMWKVCLATTLL